MKMENKMEKTNQELTILIDMVFLQLQTIQSKVEGIEEMLSDLQEACGNDNLRIQQLEKVKND
jgi:hypothetical protein